MQIFTLSLIRQSFSWTWPLFFSFLTASLAQLPMSRAQSLSGDLFCGTYTALPSQNRHADSLVYDRFGNKFDAARLAVSKTRPGNDGDYSGSGYFALTFLGNPSSQATAVVAQVFADISNIIEQRKAANSCDLSPSETVDLQVVWINFSNPDSILAAQLGIVSLAANAGAIGTPFYSGPNDLACTEVLLDRPFIKINGGRTAAGLMDGRILINSNYPWNYNSNLPSGSFTGLLDLYSAVLHEGMHVLGYASRMGFNDAYSLWDQALRVVDNYQPNGGGANPQHVLLNPSNCTNNCWQSMPNFINIARYSCSEVTAGADVVMGDAAIAPIGGNPNLDPSSPGAINNMLSHLSPTGNGQNVNYVMQQGLGFNQARRVMTDPEQEIFCTLGYKVNSSTVTCEGCYAIANSDRSLDLNLSCCPKVYYSCAGGSIHISQQDLLCNDVGNSTLKVTRLRQSSFNPNLQITPSGDGWDLSLSTPQYASFFLSFVYTVQGCEGECRLHNQNAEFLWFIDNCQPSIAADPCTNLLVVQDFENFSPEQAPVSNYNVWFGRPFRFEGNDNIGTPDIINANNGNNYLHLFNKLDNPATSSSGREAVTLELHDCIEPGYDLNLALDLSRVLGNGAAALEVWGSNNSPYSVLENPKATIPNNCVAPSLYLGEHVFEPLCITTISATNIGSFAAPNLHPAFPNGPFSWSNNTNQNICFLTLVPSGAPEIGIGIDNITAIRVSKPIITAENIAPAEVCAGGTMNVAFKVCAPSLPGIGTTLVSPTLNLPPNWTLTDGSLAPFSLSTGECKTFNFQVMVPADAAIGTMPELVFSGTAAGVCKSTAWTSTAKVLVTDCSTPAGFTCACGPGGLHIDAGVASTDPDQNVSGLSVTATPLNGGQATHNDYSNFGKCLAIRGNLLIDNNFDLMIEGGEIKMQPGAKITVKAGAKLTLKGVNGGNPAEPTHLGIHGCEKMWRGIVVEPGGELNLLGNIIQDAEYAVDVKGDSIMPYFDATSNDFDRNHVGVRIDGAVIQSQPFQKNKFRASSALLPVYSSDNLDWHPLYPFTGLDLSMTVFTIGQPEDSTSENLFTNLRNGILTEGSAVEVYYARFMTLFGSVNYNLPPDEQHPQGVGIFAKNGGLLKVHNATFGGGPRNISWRAIHVVHGNLEAKGNSMYDIASGIYATPDQATSIVIENNSFRVTLANFPLAQAAFVINNPAAATDISILHNDPIQIKGNGPAILLSNGLYNGVAKRNISDNYIYHSCRFQEGIKADHSGGWTMESNHIFYSGFPETNVSTQLTRGIFLSNSDQCLLRGNEIRATDGSLIGTDMHGIELLGSARCTLCCNITDKTTVGNYFMGNCDPTYLRSNQMYDHTIGLQCDGVGTVIGDQNWLGNNWLGTYEFLGALHTGSAANISGSQFRIELPEVNPLWPPNCNPDPLGVWFVPRNGSSGSCAQCPARSLGSDLESIRKLSDNEIQIAQNQYASEHPYDRTTQYEGEYELYREMKMHPYLHGQDVEADKFFERADRGSIGQLYAVENQIAQLELTAKDNYHLMAQMSQQLESLAQMRQEMDELYRHDIHASRQQKQISLANARLLLKEWKVISDAIEAETRATLPLILRQNEAITANDEWSNNRKIVNRIHLQTLMQPNHQVTEQQMNDLLLLAGQCMLLGGDAVLEARALYNSFASKPLAFNDLDVCEVENKLRGKSTTQSTEAAKIAYKASILPNPAKDRFTVQIKDAAPNETLSVQIIGLNGAILKEMTTRNGETLPLDCLPGLYFCHVYVGDVFADVVKLVVVP